MNPPPSEPIPHGINCQCLQCGAGRITTRKPFPWGYATSTWEPPTDKEPTTPPPQSTWEPEKGIEQFLSDSCREHHHGTCNGLVLPDYPSMGPCNCDCHPPKDTPQESILEEAQRIISGDRRDSYGDAKESFERIARGWSDILKSPVNARQVALCMIWLKVCRDANKPGRDHMVDIAGYAGLADQVVDNPTRKP